VQGVVQPLFWKAIVLSRHKGKKTIVRSLQHTFMEKTRNSRRSILQAVRSGSVMRSCVLEYPPKLALNAQKLTWLTHSKCLASQWLECDQNLYSKSERNSDRKFLFWGNVRSRVSDFIWIFLVQSHCRISLKTSARSGLGAYTPRGHTSSPGLKGGGEVRIFGFLITTNGVRNTLRPNGDTLTLLVRTSFSIENQF